MMVEECFCDWKLLLVGYHSTMSSAFMVNINDLDQNVGEYYVEFTDHTDVPVRLPV